MFVSIAWAQIEVWVYIQGVVYQSYQDTNHKRILTVKIQTSLQVQLTLCGSSGLNAMYNRERGEQYIPRFLFVLVLNKEWVMTGDMLAHC